MRVCSVRFLPACFVLVAALSGLSACAVVSEMQAGLFDTTKVNLTDSAYAAADVLAQQTNSHMTHATPLRTMIITDINHPNEVTAFGAQLANQLGSRFVQLGYNVRAMPMAPSTIQASLIDAPVPLASAVGGAPQPTINNAPSGVRAVKNSATGSDCVVTGNYTRLKHSLLVSLRIIQGADQRIIAAYDYTLPLTSEIDELSMGAIEREKRKSGALQPVLVNTN